MIMKITLDIDGKARTFQKIVNMRMTRTAYELDAAFAEAMARNKQKIPPAMFDTLLAWVVEAFDGQFTTDQVMEGYSGSFLELRLMAQELVTSLSDAVVDFPKTTAPEISP